MIISSNKPDAAFVAGVVAVVAAGSLEEFLALRCLQRFIPRSINIVGADFGFFAALGADAADQSLGQNRFDRGGDHERLDAHVFQPRDRARRVVGVQRAEDQVAGQRRLDRRFRPFPSRESRRPESCRDPAARSLAGNWQTSRRCRDRSESE